MCLYVEESFVLKPKKKRTCLKLLEWTGRCWRTPYRDVKVPINHGHFVPKKPSKRVLDYAYNDRVEGGYIHAYKYRPEWDGGVRITSKMPDNLKKMKKGTQFYFKAIAYDIAAYGGDDLVCKKLYIPAFDTRLNPSCMW